MWQNVKTILCVVLTVAALMFAVSEAGAVPLIEFGINTPTPGTVGYTGGSSPLIGVGIQVDNITGLNTPLRGGASVACISCVLTFETGNFVGSDPSNPNRYNYSPGGFISVNGGVDLTNNGILGDAGDIPDGTALLVGTFVDTPRVIAVPGTLLRLGFSLFLDRQNLDLTDFWGVSDPANLWNGELNLSFAASGAPPDSFFSVVLNGDIVNTPFAPVPEPSTLLLLSSAVAGFGLWRGCWRHR